MNEGKKKSLINFKKAVGQLNQIITMIDDDKYCIDIMQQNLAVVGLLKSAHAMLMEGHLNSCFIAGMDAKNPKMRQQMVAEVLKVTKMFNK